MYLEHTSLPLPITPRTQKYICLSISLLLSSSSSSFFLLILFLFFFFNLMFFIDYLEISHNAPIPFTPQSTQSTQSTLHLWRSPPQKKKQRRKRKPKFNLCCLYTYWSMVECPLASPLKRTDSLPKLPPEAINCEKLHFCTLIVIF